MDRENRQSACKQGTADILFILAFSMLISTPLLGFFLGIRLQPPLNELRPLTAKPPFSLHPWTLSISALKFRDYFNDHFGFRSELQRLYASTMVDWFGQSPTDKVVIGRDGWFFLNKYDGAYDYFRNDKPFSLAELESWKRIVEKRQQWLATRGIKYLFTIAPNKHTIYPEYMPPGITRMGSGSRLDQLIQYLRAYSEVNILDLRPRLIAAKGEERGYYLYKKTGTHWTDWGGFLAYQEIIYAAEKWFPEIEPLNWSDVEIDTVMGNGDLALMIGQEKKLKELFPRVQVKNPHAKEIPASFPGFPDLENPERAARGKIRTECAAARGPKVVMFRDSFATAMQPFLSENFSRILYVWKRQFDAGFVEAEKPQIVIQEVIERSLQSPPPEDVF